eukprot:6213683-Pleurochrysis_carterae.AAC.1
MACVFGTTRPRPNMHAISSTDLPHAARSAACHVYRKQIICLLTTLVFLRISTTRARSSPAPRRLSLVGGPAAAGARAVVGARLCELRVVRQPHRTRAHAQPARGRRTHTDARDARDDRMRNVDETIFALSIQHMAIAVL